MKLVMIVDLGNAPTLGKVRGLLDRMAHRMWVSPPTTWIQNSLIVPVHRQLVYSFDGKEVVGEWKVDA